MAKLKVFYIVMGKPLCISHTHTYTQSKYLVADNCIFQYHHRVLQKFAILMPFLRTLLINGPVADGHIHKIAILKSIKPYFSFMKRNTSQHQHAQSCLTHTYSHLYTNTFKSEYLFATRFANEKGKLCEKKVNATLK